MTRIQHIDPRALRNLMNLCEAAYAVAASQPYGDAMGGDATRLAGAYGALADEIKARAHAVGWSEPEVMKLYRSMGRAKPVTIEDIQPLYRMVEKQL